MGQQARDNPTQEKPALFNILEKGILTELSDDRMSLTEMFCIVDWVGIFMLFGCCVCRKQEKFPIEEVGQNL